MVITLSVVFCLTLNPYMCRSLEMVPDDGHEIASLSECIKGGAVGGMSFTMDHAEWHVKGFRCQESPTVMQTWLKDHTLP